jgi:hypothetical protein
MSALKELWLKEKGQ